MRKDTAKKEDAPVERLKQLPKTEKVVESAIKASLPKTDKTTAEKIKAVEELYKKKEEIKELEKEQQIKETRKLKTEEKKEKKPKRSFYEQKKRFSDFIKKAGIDAEFEDINSKIVMVSAVGLGLLTIYLIVNFIINKTFLLDAITLFFPTVLASTVMLYLVVWLGFFVIVDMKIFQRKKEIEAVFPDFLQLTAANINSGMPVDRALWFALRPRFGILAREMETVAKSTMVGENLSIALKKFSMRYDSITIQRSINLLIEGMDSGGEMVDLLMKIANNIRETEIMKKEMASNVTTYVIFILFATLGAAPFLFGLTSQLIVVMKTILSQVQVGESTASFGGFGAGGMNPDAISIDNYRIFALTNIVVSSIFAAIIVSIIQKGNAKEALKNIPVYMIIGTVLYFIAFTVLGWLFGGLLAS